MNRLTRLTAILTQLQSKRVITGTDLATRFKISQRTVYRDIKTLEEAGVPIIGETRVGYKLMEGYRLPPVMFTEEEANALITAEKFIQKNKDVSFTTNFVNALIKVKAVLQQSTKSKAELLSERTSYFSGPQEKNSTNLLSAIQIAITSTKVLRLKYHALYNDSISCRKVEPIAVYYTNGNWVLITHCQLRNEMREFRLDRILQLETQEDLFKQVHFSFSDYIKTLLKKISK